jgi:hypothetical protein
MKKFDPKSLVTPGAEITIRACEIQYDGDEGNLIVIYSPFIRADEDCQSVERVVEDMSIDLSQYVPCVDYAEIISEWREIAVDALGDNRLRRVKNMKSMYHSEVTFKVVDQGEDGVLFEIISQREQKGPFDAAKTGVKR